jgi:hypothetical protein
MIWGRIQMIWERIRMIWGRIQMKGRLRNGLFLLPPESGNQSSSPYFYFNHENHECSRKD